MQTPSPELIERLGIDKLASLPQATVRLLQLCNDPDSEFSELATVIGRDAGLASKMLHVANSPLYAQWGKFTDLNRMSVVLGLSTIRAIAVTSSIVALFSKLNRGDTRFMGSFWRQSLLCSLIARQLARRIGHRNQDEAYLAGLLHKIGQLVLFNNAHQTYSDLQRGATDPSRLLQAEQRLFDIDHLALGAWLVSHWQLGTAITDAVLYHQTPAPQMLDAPDLIKLIGVSSRLSDPQQRDAALFDAQTLLGLEGAGIAPLVEQAEAELQQAAASFGVNLQLEATTETDNTPVPPPADAGLADLVRDSALLDATKSAMWQAARNHDPYAAIQVFLNILFGLQEVLFFTVEDPGELRGRALLDNSRWTEQLRIPLQPARSLLCDALLGNRMGSSFEYENTHGTLNLVDRKLIRSTGKAGILAIPLLANSQPLGVLAIGVENSTLDTIRPQQKLLKLFVHEAARLLLTFQEEEKVHKILVDESQAEMIQKARRIRHEANNPLGIIKNYLFILKAELNDEDARHPELEIIREEIDRVEHILLGLTENLAESPTRSGQVDINGLISQLLTVLQPSLFAPKDIQVGLDLAQTIPPLRVDKDKTKQILINLLKNASEAMDAGGTVEICTRDGVFDAGRISVELEVRDTGPGLPDEVQRQLFQPVTSTKGGHHSGLGLSITARLVKELGGSIRCRTGADGTSFMILVPRRTPDEPAG